jgi:hypothetical protein
MEIADMTAIRGLSGRKHERLRQVSTPSIAVGGACLLIAGAAACSAPMLWAERWPMDTASANSSSLAFISSFFSRHAGKCGWRPFWEGVAFSVLVIAALVAIGRLVK